jgi:proline iminopeptidase
VTGVQTCALPISRRTQFMTMKALILACGAGAVLASCAAPAFYTPGGLAQAKYGEVTLDPPDQAGTAEGFWRLEPGIELYHFSRGGGEPVLVIHGGPGVPFQASWSGLDRTAGYEFIYYHQRGCGRSTVPIDRFSSGNWYANAVELDRKLGMAAQLADIERIRRILGVEKLSIIGHSYGGFLAALYAMEFPDRVGKLVLVSPASVLTMPPDGDGMDVIRAYLTEDGKRRYAEFEKVYFDYGNIFTKSESELAALNARYGGFYMDAMKAAGIAIVDSPAVSYSTGGWVVHAMFMSLGQSYDYRDRVRGITAPTLVIHGSLDLFPEGASRRYAELIPGAKFAVIPEASHFSFDEQPQEFNRIVAGFLGEKR